MCLDDQDKARQDFFNSRADTWLDTFYKDPDTGAHIRHRERIRVLIDTLYIKPSHHILDLGCGSGVLVPYLLERLDRSGTVVEMDYAQSMIEANRLLHTDPRVSFQCSHVMDMPFEKECFDAVICFACFPHFQDQEGALKKIANVLKPGGRLTIAHLMSSKEIAGHHNTETAVSNDNLPPRDELETGLLGQGLSITGFMDKPGNYCLTAVKAGKSG